MKKSTLTILIIAIIIATITALLFTTNKKEKAQEITEIKAEEKLEDQEKTKYSYFLEEIWDNQDFKGQKLLKENQSTKKTEVVFDNIKNEIEELTQDKFLGLEKIAQTPNENKIYFAEVPLYSERIYLNLFTFDTENENLKESKLNTVINNSGYLKISPDQSTALYIDDENENGLSQEILIIDLENEKVSKEIELEDNETLNAGYSYNMGANYNAEFKNNSEIEYSVYNQDKKPNGEYDLSDTNLIRSFFIENRNLKLD